jgi:ABC-2 type transport system permease protein
MFSAVLRVLALVRKELLAILKDPRGRAVIIGPPIIQCFLFGYAATYDLTNVPYAVLDQDRSAASAALLARLDGTGVFRREANLNRAADVKTHIDDRRALVAVQIDQNFERRLLSGTPASVQIIADGRNSNTAGTAVVYITTIVEAFNAEWRALHQQADPPVQLVMRSWYNPNLQSRWNMIPSLVGTLTMLQVLVLTAMSVAREREEGTFDQLLVTPFRPAEIMVGKAVPSMLIGVGQATLILLIAQLWFRIPFAGSFVTLYAGLFFFLLAAIGIALLISSFVATMQQAMLFTFLVMMPFTILSGLTTPISNMPPAIQKITVVNPLRYAIDMAQRVYLEGAGLDRLTSDLWPLAVMAAVTLPVAAWMFRHRLG